jgi:hypothetical protein
MESHFIKVKRQAGTEKAKKERVDAYECEVRVVRTLKVGMIIRQS